MASTLCNYLPEVLCEFPQIDDTVLRGVRKSVDESFKSFVRAYGHIIDAITHPLQLFLNWLEALFVNTPWFIFLAVMVLVVYFASRNMRIVVLTVVGMLFIGFVGLWEDTMITLAIVTVSTILAIVIGIPIGILMARSDRAQSVVNPILDVMQTLRVSSISSRWS